MKGDFTRTTFKPENHYRAVNKQQGRVDLDADWNEQLDITAHRVETGALDVIGRCGAPIHDAGFGIVTDPADLPPDQQAAAAALLPLQPGDFIFSAGRLYAHGILCQNESPLKFTQQPDLPDAEPLESTGLYLAYLDVWFRHLTALDDPAIREVALGGPDTATRTKTV
ncbi:MAG TPA: DUF6519 domain-containing protein, partial [Methylomirabilota bacterium]|nr:DUF6519 domain-containing protein [Methylomirabilota bacterium]